MCSPQPAQVGFVQFSQVTRAHMVVSFGCVAGKFRRVGAMPG